MRSGPTSRKSWEKCKKSYAHRATSACTWSPPAKVETVTGPQPPAGVPEKAIVEPPKNPAATVNEPQASPPTPQKVIESPKTPLVQPDTSKASTAEKVANEPPPIAQPPAVKP